MLKISLDIFRWWIICAYHTGIQYRWQQKDEIKGSIPKLVAPPEYCAVYQHQGMLLQNLQRHYLYIVIRLPKLRLRTENTQLSELSKLWYTKIVKPKSD